MILLLAQRENGRRIMEGIWTAEFQDTQDYWH